MGMKKIDKKGFTLLELMLSITLSAVVMVIIFSTFLAINKAFVHRQLQNEQRQLIEILEELLNDELRYVYNIRVEDNGIGSYPNATYSENDRVYIDGNKALEDGVYGDNCVSLLFSKASKDVLNIEITIDEPILGVETIEVISIKLLNISIKTVIEEQTSNTGSNNISYTKK